MTLRSLGSVITTHRADTRHCQNRAGYPKLRRIPRLQHRRSVRNILICRRQGRPGLSRRWHPRPSAHRTGPSPLTVKLVAGHGAGASGSSGRDALIPPRLEDGLWDGRGPETAGDRGDRHQPGLIQQPGLRQAAAGGPERGSGCPARPNPARRHAEWYGCPGRTRALPPFGAAGGFSGWLAEGAPTGRSVLPRASAELAGLRRWAAQLGDRGIRAACDAACPLNWTVMVESVSGPASDGADVPMEVGLIALPRDRRMHASVGWRRMRRNLARVFKILHVAWPTDTPWVRCRWTPSSDDESEVEGQVRVRTLVGPLGRL